MPIARSLSISTRLVALVAVAACGDSTSSSREQVSLSFRTGALGSPVSGLDGPIAMISGMAPPIVISGNGNTLQLDRVDLTLADIELDRNESDDDGDSDTGADSDGDSDSDGPNGESQFGVDSVVVQLPLGGGVITPITVSIPSGTYESFEARVRQVRLLGTFNGQAFDVTVPVRSELEFNFDPPFNVTSAADQLNITLGVDPASWLRDSAGAPIDPRALATDGTLRAQVRNAIARSFRAFEDSDRDGDDSDSDSDDR